jgi:hypothetical protein
MSIDFAIGLRFRAGQTTMPNLHKALPVRCATLFEQAVNLENKKKQDAKKNPAIKLNGVVNCGN